jgi:uncharacterized protein YlzI (FlbEa/FlbD family)
MPTINNGYLNQIKVNRGKIFQKYTVQQDNEEVLKKLSDLQLDESRNTDEVLDRIKDIEKKLDLVLAVMEVNEQWKES